MPSQYRRNPLEQKYDELHSEIVVMRSWGERIARLEGHKESEHDAETGLRTDRQTRWIIVGVLVAIAVGVTSIILQIVWH